MACGASSRDAGDAVSAGTLAAHLAAVIGDNEACRLVVYDDATGRPLAPGAACIGHPTIGWGRALDVNGLSQDEADILRQHDCAAALAAAEAVLGALCWRTLVPARQLALADIAYELGRGGLERFGRMLAAVRARNWTAAHDECLASRLPPARARRNATALLTGVMPGLTG